MNLPVLTLIVLALLQSTTAPARGSSNGGQELATLQRHAEAGDVKAQVQLGLAYASGDGVEADSPEAVKWFRKAADQGDASGEYYLGELYATGRGIRVDDEEALKWLRKAAEQGEPHAQYNLAAMYTQGLGVSKDDSEAAKWTGGNLKAGAVASDLTSGATAVRNPAEAAKDPAGTALTVGNVVQDIKAGYNAVKSLVSPPPPPAPPTPPPPPRCTSGDQCH